MSASEISSVGDVPVLRTEKRVFALQRPVTFAYKLWRDLSVRLKLYLLVSICLISFTVAVVYMVETGKRDINNLTKVLYSVTIRSSSSLLGAEKDLQQLMLEHQKFTYTTGATGSEPSGASLEAVGNKVHTARSELEQLGVLDTILYRDTAKTLNVLFTELNSLLDAWSAEISKPEASRAAAEIIDGQFTDIGTAITKITSSLESYSKINILAAEKEALRKERFGFIMLFLVVAATLIMATLTTHHIVSILRNVNRKLSSITGGDLTAAPEHIYSKDDLGQLSRSVDTTVSDLRRIISLIASNATVTEQSMQSVVTGSQSTSHKADIIAGSMESISLSVRSQYSGIAETSRSVEEMALGVNQIAATATQIADYSQEMNSSANHGLHSVSSLISQMSEVSRVISSLEAVISSLSQKSAQMNQIVSNITGFAEDTNLLSLNASIEAARAGEHGRGFLVVASEMRRLSDHSRQAASEVSSILSDTVGDITQASILMQHSVEETRLGNASAHEVNTVIQEIIASISSITNQLHEASAVTEQISASSEEVAATMNQLTSGAESVSQIVSEVNIETKGQLEILSDVVHSSNDLKQVVSELRESVDSFKL